MHSISTLRRIHSGQLPTRKVKYAYMRSWQVEHDKPLIDYSEIASRETGLALSKVNKLPSNFNHPQDPEKWSWPL